ncbi:MAG: hypothetical protein NTV06_02475 [candidate division Zixibacteria bacterium]|nr:hypothetical protein [candidate division Zixibacteria bacterium]
MWEDFNLTKLPPYGKVFVGLFVALMLAVTLWATTLALLESGLFGEVDTSDKAQQQYDYTSDIDAIASDSLAVTPPDWVDSGQQEPITGDDLDKFSTDSKSDWGLSKWVDNLKLSHVHLNGHTALFFALGLVFMFSTVSAKKKKIVYWIFAIGIILHAIGLIGLDYSIYAGILIFIGGVPLLASILYMVFKIFGDLRKKVGV